MSRRIPNFLPTAQEGDGLLPWVIGVMLFLTALAGAFFQGLSSGLDNWSRDLSTHITVQIVSPDTAERTRQTEAALRLLRATPGIRAANSMADSDVLALLSPWLGDIQQDSGLPIPNLVDVTLDNDVDVNISALTERLKATAPGASLDDPKVWLRQILRLATTVRILLVAIAVMVLLATAAIVIFGCRAGLATHRESIAFMHLMGAEDTMIAQAFDRRYLVHGLLGGLGGVLMAILAVVGLSHLAAGAGQGLISAIVPNTDTLLWLIGLPILSGMLALITARITVMRALKAMV